MITLYGIPNCDTVKKARAELDSLGIAYHFHDYKKAGADPALLRQWCKRFGHEQVINRRGTSWRKLSDEQRDGLTEARAVALMQEQPSLIKRPIVVAGDTVLLGYEPGGYRALR